MADPSTVAAMPTISVPNEPSPTAPVESKQSGAGLQILDYSSIVDQDHPSLDPWSNVLPRVIKAIVTIKCTSLRSFDTDFAGNYEGTGFVVDSERGIILSNRHIVNQGPTTAIAIFGNYEEITLKQDYSDPVHDFGFFRYDPAKVKFAKVEEIELYPEGAKIGLDIKVCGNNAGEKLSILSATLARLDRDAPSFSSGYNDFNINYFQAASGTTGGSSGSPVLDSYGRAIALNVGGNANLGSGFFLPLEPVVRALKLIQAGKSVPRGTLQTIFVHSSYDQLKRIGLPQDVEKQCRERNKTGTGLLSISQVLLEGPGYKAGLAVGDVLIDCDQEAFGRRFIDSFSSLWEIIDASVDKEISLTVYRGKQRKEVTATVQDLHSITPSTFLEAGDAILHPLSYQLAITYHMPCKGLYVAQSGVFNWLGPDGRFLITQLNGQAMDSLDTFQRVFLSIPDGNRVEFKYVILGGCEEYPAIVEIDHRFYAAALCSRNGVWTRKLLVRPSVLEPRRLRRAPTLMIEGAETDTLKKILTLIRCRVPIAADGILPSTIIGIGVIVATNPYPMILTSRATVPSPLSDISITIGKRNLPARIVYMGLVVILTVDDWFPPLLPIPNPSSKEYKVGDTIEIFGLNVKQQLIHKHTEISEISGILSTQPASRPSWHISNVEGYLLVDPPITLGGIVVDPANYSIVAIWMPVNDENWFAGLNYHRYIHPIIQSLQAGKEAITRSCGWKFGQINLARALDFGLPEHHATQIDKAAESIRAGPQVVWVVAKLHQFTHDLEIGDFILEINGETVGRMADVHNFSHSETTNVLVLRGRQEKEIVVHSRREPPPIRRVVSWIGVIMQQTPNCAFEYITPTFLRAAEEEGITNIESCVYISAIARGSPAVEFLSPVTWILEIDDKKVRSIDELLDIVSGLKGRGEREEYIRVKLLWMRGTVTVVGVKLNSEFWPTWTLEWKDKKWHRTELE